jgi:hypothetical protein
VEQKQMKVQTKKFHLSAWHLRGTKADEEFFFFLLQNLLEINSYLHFSFTSPKQGKKQKLLFLLNYEARTTLSGHKTNHIFHSSFCVCGLQNELPCVFTHTWLDLDTLFGVSPLYQVVRATDMVWTCHDSIFKCQSPLH